VPEREQQIETFCDLIPPRDAPFTILELCGGAGVLAGALLQRFPNATVYDYDGSPEMLDHARAQLARFGERFQTLRFDLADHSWRRPSFPVHAVVSSLAIHHLDGAGKQQLFRDIHAMLEPGGVLAIADVVETAGASATTVAANAWDAAVRKRALDFDGNLDAFAAFERQKWNMYRFFDPDDIDKPSRLIDQLKWLEAAGFADVDVYWMRAGHAIFGGRKAS
ncbi:MAG TPA: class I SAM-dependent methyltransferase, partial [Roseiflexaceae bacterium]|nr:class I SAM-dependent methyltransferase [Roseiflexaceae bacterium]